jgi:hypothetical protein
VCKVEDDEVHTFDRDHHTSTDVGRFKHHGGSQVSSRCSFQRALSPRGLSVFSIKCKVKTRFWLVPSAEAGRAGPNKKRILARHFPSIRATSAQHLLRNKEKPERFSLARHVLLCWTDRLFLTSRWDHECRTETTYPDCGG